MYVEARPVKNFVKMGCEMDDNKNLDMNMELFFNILFDKEAQERFMNDCREAGIVEEDGNDEKTKIRSSY